MLMCMESEVKTGQHGNVMRIIPNSPEPMVVLAFDWTLENLERLCTSEAKHTALHLNPTFDLSSFHLTDMSNHDLIVSSRMGGKHQVMPGPLFIHQRKPFSSYHFITSQLVGLRPALQNVKAVDIDGEQALAYGLATQFKSTIHLRCLLYVRTNLELKLSELKVPKAVT